MARHRQKPRQRAVNTRRKKFRTSENKFVPPRTPEEFFAMPKKYQQLWGDIGQVTTEVRLGASLAQAARKFDVDPRTVRRLAAPALRKLRNGRWVAKKYDRLLRVLTLPSPQGLIEVGVRDSRQATLVGRYWNAVDLYRDTDDASALRKFRGKHIVDASGKRIPLLTNLHELDRLGSAGVLSFESLYARVA